MLLRYAPSLSGPLHFGNLASLSYNTWLKIAGNGRLIWRVDGYRKGDWRSLREQLITASSYGHKFDGFHILDERARGYWSYILKIRCFLYPCYETAEELRSGSRYDVSESHSRTPCYRLDLRLLRSQVGATRWHEGVTGWRNLNSIRHMNDPIVIKSDGLLTYVLSSVLWDVRHGVTHVVRGNDLINTSPIHWMVSRWLGHSITYYHHGLLTLEGAKLSKQRYADMWFNPVDYLGRFGHLLWHVWIAHHSLNRCLRDIRDFAPDYININDKKLDLDFLIKWSSKRFRSLRYEDLPISRSLAPLTSRSLWRVVRGNCSDMSEFVEWSRWVSDGGGSGTHRVGRSWVRTLRLLISDGRDSPPADELMAVMSPIRLRDILLRSIADPVDD